MTLRKNNFSFLSTDRFFQLLPLSVFLSFSSYLLFIRGLFSNKIFLEDTRGGIVSQATYAGMDINNRVNIFYYRVFILVLTFWFFVFIVNFIRNSGLSGSKFKLLSFLSSTGIVLLMPYLFMGEFSVSAWLILLLVTVVTMGFFLKFSLTIERAVVLLAVYFVLVFTLRNLWLSVDAKIISWLLVAVFLGFVWVVPRLIENKSNTWSYIVRVAFLLVAAFPIIQLLGKEAFSIFYLRAEIALFPIYTIVLLTGIVVFYCYRKKNAISNMSERRFYERRLFPLLAVSFSLILHYSFFIVQEEDMFELANQANSIMRLFKFGEAPLFEAYSSHLLYDQYYGILYTVLNGYDTVLGFNCYKFLNYVIVFIIWYYMLLWITRRGWLSILLILFFPYLEILIPEYYALSLVTVFFLYRLYLDYTYGQLLKLAAWCLFVILWRIDMGVANTVAASAIMLHFVVWKREIKVLKHIAYTLIPVMIVGGVSFLFIKYSVSFDMVGNLTQILDYIRSNVAHGYYNVSLSNDRYYYLHYHFFPIVAVLLIVGIIGYLLVNDIMKTIRFKYILLISFLVIYFLFNFQRGLVRHSLMEGDDLYVSSFIYLILALSLAYLSIRKKQVLWFVGTSVVVIVLCKLPMLNVWETNQWKWSERLKKSDESVRPLMERKTRILIDSAYTRNNHLATKKFMQKYFSDTATFIDFCLSPMLYYHTQRPVPSVFNQYMQNTVSPYLQKKNIESLSKYDIPLVVFAQYKDVGWNSTDGIANTLRYYHTVNYIYNRYRPLGIINDRYIWIRKELDIVKDSLPVDSGFVYDGRSIKVQRLMWLFGNTKEQFIKAEKKVEQQNIKVVSDTIVNIKFPASVKKEKGNWLVLEIESQQEGINYLSIIIKSGREQRFKNDEVIFECYEKPGKKYYLFPVSTFYKWYLYDEQVIELKMPSDKFKLLSVGYTEEL